jgi:tyrosinase
MVYISLILTHAWPMLIQTLAHQAASFLPWHRYFLNIFETSLRQSCGFTDQLPYWDWSLDWESPSSSPIWDSESGFGGDGNVTGLFIINEGRCLVNGPFMDMRPLYDNFTANPHCISRGFKNVETGEAGLLSGHQLRPEAMEEILGQEDFEKFHDRVEQNVHDALHNGINGDFGSLTSGNGGYIRHF